MQTKVILILSTLKAETKGKSLVINSDVLSLMVITAIQGSNLKTMIKSFRRFSARIINNLLKHFIGPTRPVEVLFYFLAFKPFGTVCKHDWWVNSKSFWIRKTLNMFFLVWKVPLQLNWVSIACYFYRLRSRHSSWSLFGFSNGKGKCPDDGGFERNYILIKRGFSRRDDNFRLLVVLIHKFT